MSIVFNPKIPASLKPVKPVANPNGVPKHCRDPLSTKEKDEFVRLRALNVSHLKISERIGRSSSLWHRASQEPDLKQRIETARNKLLNGECHD